MSILLNRLRTWRPAPLPGSRREYWLGSAALALALLLTEWLSHGVLGDGNPWFTTSMAASAALVLVLPASPLAQPWPLVGGNLLAALVGVACYRWLGDGEAAAAIAAAVAVAAMSGLRCFHPPAVAVAATAVLGGPAIHRLGYGFALAPVVLNALLILLSALALNKMLGRRYPHQAAAAPGPHGTQDPLPSRRIGLQQQDLDTALSSFGELLDIDAADLRELVLRAQLNAQSRQWSGVHCRDIMSRDLVCVMQEDGIDEAWSRLVRHGIKALPVTCADGTLAGIVSLHDFFLAGSAPDPRRLPLMRTARVVADIMTREVRAARPEQSVADLVRSFSDRGLHHMPVVDAQGKVVGMVTQSDLVAALFRLGGGTEPERPQAKSPT